MLFGNIKIGDRLEITQLQERKLDRSYVSQVEDVISEDEIVIHVPISYGQLVKLSMNKKYSMLFFSEKGMIRFDAEITGYTKENGFHFMRAKMLSKGERIQRRDFFRFNCLLPLKFSIIEESASEDEFENTDINDAIIKDIGGGGLRFVTNESIGENGKIKCIIMLGDDYFVISGKVLHKQYFPKSNYKYQYRVQFVNILEYEQERIIQYIFNEQRRMMQKNQNLL